MEMELELVLNQTSSKFFVKMTRIRGFINQKNHTGGFIKNKKRVRNRTEGSFEIKNQTILVSKSHSYLVNCKETVLSFFLSFLLCVIRD